MASFVEAEPPMTEQTRPTAQPAKGQYRSWRKKYRKMKLKFDEKMKESGSLCKEEIRAKEVARRLQEQNDRILDMLLDINSSLQIPSDMRFNLHDPSRTPPLSAIPELESDDPTFLTLKVEQLRQQVRDGHLNQLDFIDLEKALTQKLTNLGTKPFDSLASVPHTDLNNPSTATVLGDTLNDILGISETNKDGYGYMEPNHVDAFLLDLDRSIGEAYSNNYPPLVHPPTPEPTEKDIAANNPVSVQNYLRRYHPQIFLQDAENALAEKATREGGGTGGGGSKRGGGKRASKGTAGIETKMELDPLDEELGIMPEITGSGRKRARGEEDGSYRPKGGSSRPSKKRKAEGDGEGGGRGKKKARASNGGEA
ncbi:MAG: hypothetical protein Q9165_007457 [Trypethelium subeluteriae]